MSDVCVLMFLFVSDVSDACSALFCICYVCSAICVLFLIVSDMSADFLCV